MKLSLLSGTLRLDDSIRQRPPGSVWSPPLYGKVEGEGDENPRQMSKSRRRCFITTNER